MPNRQVNFEHLNHQLDSLQKQMADQNLKENMPLTAREIEELILKPHLAAVRNAPR